MDDLFASWTDDERKQAIQKLTQLGGMEGRQKMYGERSRDLSQEDMSAPRAYGWGGGLGQGLASLFRGINQRQIQNKREDLYKEQGDLRGQLFDLLYRRGKSAPGLDDSTMPVDLEE